MTQRRIIDRECRPNATSLVGKYDGAATDVQKLFVDGVQATALTDIAIRSTSTVSAQVHNNGSFNTSLTPGVNNVLVAQFGELTDEQAARLSADPFGWLRRVERVVTVSATPVSATFTSPWEALAGLAALATPPTESELGLTITLAAPWEFRLGILAAGSGPT